RQYFQPFRPNTAAHSFRSEGTELAPAMTLNKIYHCVPSARRKILPQLIEMEYPIKNPTIKGNAMLTGNDAAICASGWANLATDGRKPIHTPIGVQITVAAATMIKTRPMV